MAATSYKLRGLEPPDLRAHPEDVRKQFWVWVVEFGIAAKVADIKAGLDKDGKPLRPITAKTRKYRRSAMTPSGKGDPNAPPLIPGHMKSRTISLLAGRAFSTHAEFHWRFDAWTGNEWGAILAIQARKGRDVIGLSKESTAKVKSRAWRRWADWKAGRYPVHPVMPRAIAAVGVPQVGSYDMSHATFGIGVDDASKFATGQWTGGMTAPEWAAYFRQSAAAAIPGRPNPRVAPHPDVGPKFNRLLAHAWNKAGPPPGVITIPKPGPKRPVPKPQKAAMAPKPATKPPPVPEVPRFGESKAKVYMDDDAAAAVRSIFGRDMTHAELASLTGAPDDAVVRVLTDLYGGGLELEVSHPKFEVMARTIRRQGGKLIIHNDIFKLHKQFQGTSLGAEVFGRQVENASKLGVSHLETQAFRIKGDTYVDDKGETKEKWAGYYVWPGYGYAGPLPQRSLDDLAASSLPAALKAATDIRDLYATPEGKAWWKEHGRPIDVEFDLQPGSYSMDKFAALLKQKRSGVK